MQIRKRWEKSRSEQYHHSEVSMRSTDTHAQRTHMCIENTHMLKEYASRDMHTQREQRTHICIEGTHTFTKGMHILNTHIIRVHTQPERTDTCTENKHTQLAHTYAHRVPTCVQRTHTHTYIKCTYINSKHIHRHREHIYA